MNNKLDPRAKYLCLNLKWGLEDYIHEIGLNVMDPSYVTTKLYHKGILLPNPEYLFKFYSDEEHNFESLEKQYLYFGNPSDFNDTFDCIISEDNFINSFLDEEYTQNIGVCNFTTKMSNDMWNYYTNKHKGFAVKFKHNKLFLPFSDLVSIKSHVLYLQKNIPDHPNLLEALKSLIGKHFPEPIKAWQHQVLMQHDLCRKEKTFFWESEYRIITFKREYINRKISFKTSTVDSIYLGSRINPENIKRLKEIIRAFSNIKVYKINPNPKNQRLEPILIKNLDSLF